MNNEDENIFRYPYPNDADFNFNYNKLILGSKDHILADRPKNNLRIAVIGAGISGTLAAREFFKCGLGVDLFEATDVVGGRTRTIPLKGQKTGFELGAMRFPFFDQMGQEHCLLDRLRQEFGITFQEFPNPGVAHQADTGLYFNYGRGPELQFKEPKLIIWKKDEVNAPVKEIERVNNLWVNFRDMFVREVKKIYATSKWTDFWNDIVSHYWDKRFDDFCLMERIEKYDPEKRGFFGGLGLNEVEFDTFYTLGIGDGGWGAFFGEGLLWIFRTVLFGYCSNLKLAQGRFDEESGKFLGGPNYNKKLKDSLNHEFNGPNYIGIQSIVDSLMYLPVKTSHGPSLSFYEASKSEKYEINLFVSNPVSKIRKDPKTGKIFITSREIKGEKVYDAVVLTMMPHPIELGIKIEGFGEDEFPIAVRKTFHKFHGLISTKVFVSLKDRYWEKSKIPQVIVTDDFLQQTYGYAIETKSRKDPGAVLLSYTWATDSVKFLCYDDEELIDLCLKQLDDMLSSCKNVGQKISPFINRDESHVIHWSKEKYQGGIMKSYFGKSWKNNYRHLRFNRKYGKKSGLYFGGAGFSVTDGWIEGGLRMAMHGVVNLLKNCKAEFRNKEFDFERDFPEYSSWSPPKGF